MVTRYAARAAALILFISLFAGPATMAQEPVVVSGTPGAAIKKGHAVFSDIAALAQIIPWPGGQSRIIPKRPTPPSRTQSAIPAQLSSNPAASNTARTFGLNGGKNRLLGGDPLGGDILSIFQGCTDPRRSIPPDTNGAVGPTRIVSTTNDEIRIQDRVGNVLYEKILIDDFWIEGGVASPGEFLSDPRVNYDPSVDRFIVTEATFDAPNESVLLAVSDTGDPTAGWTFYRIKADPASQLLPDYPNVGFNSKWYIISENMYPNGSGGTFHPRFFVFDKADLINPAGTAKHTLLDADPNGFTMSPAITYDAGQPDVFAVEMWDPNARTLRLSKISGSVGSETLTIGFAFPELSKTWDQQPPAPQKGSGSTIDSGDPWRPMSLAYRNGTLWGVHCVGPNDGASPRAASQWFNLELDGAVIQDGRIDDPTSAQPFFYIYPSIAANQINDVVIGFTRVSINEYASGAFAVRNEIDPPGTFQAETVYKPGEAGYDSGVRWGDFSGTMVDPDDTTFWTIQEVAMSPNAHFGTWWAHLSAIPPLIALNIVPSSVNGGDSATGTVRLRDIAVQDTPVNITSDDPSTAWPDQSQIIVPTGQRSATFTISTDSAVVGVHNVTFTATNSLTGDQGTALLTVTPLFESILFSEGGPWTDPFDAAGGDLVYALVTLSQPAPEGGLVVSLGTTDPEAAITTPSVTIQAGRTSQIFYVFTKPIPETEPVLVFGQAQGSLVFGTLIVHAPVPTAVTVTPPTVTGGSQATGTVYLTSPAPPGGIAIALASSNTSVATVLPFAIVQQSKTSATFPIMTVPVTVNKVVQISASNEGVTRSANLTVTASAGLLSSLVFNPSTVNGGTQAKGVIILTRPAPTGGLLVTLTKGPDPQSAIGTLPTVTVPAGYSSATFYVPTNWVPVDSTVRITATSGTSSKSANLTVRAPHVTSVTAIPVVIHSGTQTTVRVFMSGPSPMDITVPITYTGPVTGPASITVPSGKTAVSFLATGTSVTASTTAKITATYPVGQSKTATITVTP